MVESRSYLRRIMHPFFVSLIYLFLYVPIIVLVLFSFNDSPVSLTWAGFSLRWYRALLDSPELLAAARTSLIVATMATALSVSLGILLVTASHWWRPRFLFGLFYSNILIPDSVIAIGILGLFSYLFIPLGYPSLILGHTLIGLGFVVPILRARFNEFDPVLTEASLDLGADQFQTCRRVIIPLLTPGIIAAALLVFTLSLDDFMVSFFCAGPRIQTLSLYIYFQVKTLVDPTINAISTCLLVVSSILVLLLCYFKVIDRAVSHD